jgi:O-antigen ligase
MREILFGPLLSLIIGNYFSRTGYNIFDPLYQFLRFNILYVFFFQIFFPNLSYGATGRLTSIYQGEHLPGIFAALFVIFALVKHGAKNKAWGIDIFIILISLYIILLSGSRSVLLGLIVGGVAYFLTYGRQKAVKALIYTVGAGALILTYLFFDERGFLYNILARVEQYSLAFDLIQSNPFLGIGIDKYGYLGGVSKTLSVGGLSTTTMDSSFLKYIVNTGLPVFVFGVVVFLAPLYKSKLNKRDRGLIFFLLGFSFVMGAFTGKFGAYPINYIVYIYIGIYSCPSGSLLQSAMFRKEKLIKL